MAIGSELLVTLVDDNGKFQREQVLLHLNISETELASMLGLVGNSNIEKCINAEPHKTRLKQSLIIIEKVDAWCTSRANAIEWFINQPIPALGNITPRSAVLSGNFEALNDYIDVIAIGGYA
jgi:hypothetical protein